MTVFERIIELKEFENFEDEQIIETINDTVLFLNEFYIIPANLMETAKYYYSCYLLNNFGGIKLRSVQLTEVSESYDIVTADWLGMFESLFGRYKKSTNLSVSNQNSFTVF